MTPPVITPRSEVISRRIIIALAAVLVMCIVLLTLCVVGITGMFRLGGDTRALQSALTTSLTSPLDKRIAVRAGFISTGLARLGSTFLDLPPEARAAIRAAKGGEVGVYHLTEHVPTGARSGLLARADETMTDRGWTRLVGVVSPDEFVAVYVPAGKFSPSRVKICALVLHQDEAVLVSAKVDLNPLMKMVEQHVNFSEHLQQVALR